MFQSLWLRTRSPVLVETIARNPSYFRSIAQPLPVGIWPGRRSIGRGITSARSVSAKTRFVERARGTPLATVVRGRGSTSVAPVGSMPGDPSSEPVAVDGQAVTDDTLEIQPADEPSDDASVERDDGWPGPLEEPPLLGG